MSRSIVILIAVAFVYSVNVGVADEIGGEGPIDRGGNTGGFWCPSDFFAAEVYFTADGPLAEIKFTAQTWTTLAAPCVWPPGGGDPPCRTVVLPCQEFLSPNIDNVMVIKLSTYTAALEDRTNLCSLAGDIVPVFVFNKVAASDFVFRDLFDTSANPGWDLSDGAEYDPDSSAPTDLDDPAQTPPNFGGPGGSLRFGNPNDPPTPPTELCDLEAGFVPTATSSVVIDGLEAGVDYVLFYWWASSVDRACCESQFACSDDSGALTGNCPPGDLWVQVFGTEELDCSDAAPSVAKLWPPNHKLVPVTIRGVPGSVTITGITQDEPVDDRGDGHTMPDAFGVGTATALLRAERMGGGNGRVYEISYRASDGGTGMCTGSVKVCVGKSSTCVDDGQQYDATSNLLPHRDLRVVSGPLRVRTYPNPFNPSTRIEYTLPTASVVSLTVYNALGQQVRALVTGEQSEGTHHALWNGQDDSRNPLPSGIYIYRLETGGLEETGRMVLIR